ncbi:hydroxymethylglutaryl-CoA synthase [Lentilactobacillus kisonensis]|uniref:Hydroxymethylglutaryl-CoA synthase n=2 Tax=Lentilactobacillus kisonensis TaxID=481722 RepID=H1LJI9_9LACO|nr:hydroxymethylglutaryl-CoA synthase [Lentilactobacillus kisonensis]EHO48561.1 hydroxymethylglutaryl-CoA synthase [Lentilactobacillus kisonensis F0435]KRL23294.1 hydroxymethylglutaryl-CoA synthase [Lentilactobacillus kisonensis DSM 19906 = JCM 15041]
MTVGIDKIGFFTSPYYIDMVDLATARNVDPNKYLIGIGQKLQAVIPETQDAVTLAANAADRILTSADKADIDMVIFGTETGVDNSKAAAIYVQDLLGISKRARAFEIKQACYGATAGIQMAYDHVLLHPESKVLVLASDIARYGLNTPGEVTQGGGAVAMLITANPRILALDGQSAFYSENIMDFWRPLYRKEAVVDGHYSTDVYIEFFKRTWKQYQDKTGRSLADFSALAFHLPFTKMGLKAIDAVVQGTASATKLLRQFDFSTQYNAVVGNLYTGSLYLSLLSLLSNSDSLKPGDRVGLFSYGSGAQGEFYSGTVAKNFDRQALKKPVDNLLDDRHKLSIPKYEKMYQAAMPITSGDITYDVTADQSRYVLRGRAADRLVYLDTGKSAENKAQ